MRHIFILIFLFLNFGNCYIAESATLPFSLSFTHDDGLSDSPVTSCCQDSFGRIWVSSRNGIFYSRGSSFVSFNNSDYIVNCSRVVFDVEEDANHNIWVVTSQGTGYYNPQTGVFSHICELDDVRITDLEPDTEGNVLFTSTSGIWRFDSQTGAVGLVVGSDSELFTQIVRIDRIRFVLLSSLGNIFSLTSAPESTVAHLKASERYTHISCKNNSSILALNSDNSLYSVAFEGAKLVEERLITELPSTGKVTNMMVYNGNYWIATNRGIIIIDALSHGVEHRTNENVMSLFHDRDGNVWAGTYNGNLLCFRNYHGSFGRFLLDGMGENLIIRSLCEDTQGNLWGGTDNGTLVRIDILGRQTLDYSSLIYNRNGSTISSIELIDDELWVLTNGGGITVLDTKDMRVTANYHFPDDRSLSVLKKKDCRLYVGTGNGLFQKSINGDSFNIIEPTKGEAVHCLAEDDRGNLWIGLYGGGLSVLSAGGEYRQIMTQAGMDGKFAKYVNCIYCDGNRVWVGTDGSGLCELIVNEEYKFDDVICHSKCGGLRLSDVSSIIPDKEGNLWLSTPSGLVRFIPSSPQSSKCYFSNEKVIGSNFYVGHTMLTSDGMIYASARNGILYFKSSDINTLFGDQKVYINDVTIGTTVSRRSVSEEGHSTLTSETLKVRRKDANAVSISFSTSDVEDPNGAEYFCRLTKPFFHNELNTFEGHVLYLGLNAGKYVFDVSLDPDDPDASHDSVTLIIRAPWYLSILAWIIYICLVATLVITTLRWYWNKRKAEKQRRYDLDEAQRQKTIMKDKMEFMTNITHEIKTPVSLISLLVDRISKNPKFDISLEQDFRSLKGSTGKLLELCNDLLEFRKIKDGKFQLSISEEDIRNQVNEASGQFMSMIQDKKIMFECSLPNHPVPALCDRNATGTIITNLLSNSVKYCEKQINITLSSDGQMVKFVVNSDGARIPAEESELIFDAFYQSRNINSSGSGIGLAYARSLAVMQDGSLFLDTSVKDFNSFVFLLPCPEGNVEIVDSGEETSLSDNHSESMPSILVVEDNVSLRNEIRDELRRSYNVSVAGDGTEAMYVIKHGIIDLVISDVMMPKMDGCELCNAIKEDIASSHILVILLTAAAGVDTHLRSLRAGADSFMEKPFRMEVLKATVDSLLKNRDIRNEQFVRSPLSARVVHGLSNVESEFMNRLYESVMDHMTEEAFSASILADYMKMDRKQLASKVRASTGLSTSEYIRTCRLKKAAELLAENKYRVNEVAYLVGYSSPSYFSQQFQSQFDTLPSDYVKSITHKQH